MSGVRLACFGVLLMLAGVAWWAGNNGLAVSMLACFGLLVIFIVTERSAR